MTTVPPIPAITGGPAPTLPKLTAKDHLEGMTLASGWTLVERLKPSVGSSGGNFGAGYRATKGNEIAFVKAIDFVSALEAADPLVALGKLVAEATFEKDVLAYCSERGMTKVLKYLGHEYISGDGTGNPLTNVSCLIMEAGDQDLRRLINVVGVPPCAWNLQVMKDVSLGLAQLHRGEIAHLDIKPSNVISFRDSVGVNHSNSLIGSAGISAAVSGAAASPVPVPSLKVKDFKAMKVADLGRVIRKNQAGPFDNRQWPGDRRYQPPERWYGNVPTDWNDSRESADAYMLASLIVYLFTGATLQSLVVPKIPIAFLPGNWTGGYDQDLKSVLTDAHAKVLHDHVEPLVMKEISAEMMAVLQALAEVDPLKRGDTKARRQLGKPVGMDRIYQKISAMAATAAAVERGRTTL
ncbi:MAG: hypothetical protein Q8M93_07235 [Polaromonas sp.]|uniref:hypothetical protein n=3 Tax=Polaromonas sp. TaxID=1869339 RepID=UPI002733A042|nr:hypothetical protein [Polaromonas sp.]MDP3246742.1 hypothetical protein [Polaromonas sp.]MDP3756383.1 hypothetical protein [Polaromonas sp.]